MLVARLKPERVQPYNHSLLGAMSHSRKDPTIRQGQQLVSSLVSTPDQELAAFRAQRAADPRLDLELVTKARDILDAVAFALRSDRPEDWRKIEQAWEAVHDIARASDRIDALFFGGVVLLLLAGIAVALNATTSPSDPTAYTSSLRSSSSHGRTCICTA